MLPLFPRNAVLCERMLKRLIPTCVFGTWVVCILALLEWLTQLMWGKFSFVIVSIFFKPKVSPFVSFLGQLGLVPPGVTLLMGPSGGYTPASATSMTSSNLSCTLSGSPTPNLLLIRRPGQYTIDLILEGTTLVPHDPASVLVLVAGQSTIQSQGDFVINPSSTKIMMCRNAFTILVPNGTIQVIPAIGSASYTGVSWRVMGITSGYTGNPTPGVELNTRLAKLEAALGLDKDKEEQKENSPFISVEEPDLKRQLLLSSSARAPLSVDTRKSPSRAA